MTAIVLSAFVGCIFGPPFYVVADLKSIRSKPIGRQTRSA
jgi:hypothetical protein